MDEKGTWRRSNSVSGIGVLETKEEGFHSPADLESDVLPLVDEGHRGGGRRE